MTVLPLCNVRKISPFPTVEVAVKDLNFDCAVMQAAVENAGNDTAAWLREEYLDFKYELSGIKQDLEVKRDEIQNVVSRLQDRQMLQDNRNYLRAGIVAYF